MIFLLDTNAVSGLMRGDSRMKAWMATVRDEDELVICTIVRGELLFGLGKLPAGRRRSELESAAARLLSAFRCEPIPETAAEHYASVKLSQQLRGLPMGENDLWIAATALALGATLVSSDQDFGQLGSGLIVVP